MSDKSYEINLHFAGDILIKINSEVIECFLEDQGEPWDTKNKPKHIFIFIKKLLLLFIIIFFLGGGGFNDDLPE